MNSRNLERRVRRLEGNGVDLVVWTHWLFVIGCEGAPLTKKNVLVLPRLAPRSEVAEGDYLCESGADPWEFLTPRRQVLIRRAAIRQDQERRAANVG
jgi:hypothetical protein